MATLIDSKFGTPCTGVAGDYTVTWQRRCVIDNCDYENVAIRLREMQSHRSPKGRVKYKMLTM